ncbi:MAG TPA: methyl-accepting chemotaxis protein [Gammaproteobacteria bacterium]|nr:methyl-accepting chemotaxis protein [Gammaproteobacteria bacterium]
MKNLSLKTLLIGLIAVTLAAGAVSGAIIWSQVAAIATPEAAASAARAVMTVSFGALLAVVALALMIIYRRMLLPVERLQSAMEARRDGADARLPELPGELRRLGEAFAQTLEHQARQRAGEHARAARDARIARALDAASLGVMVLDDAGRIAFVNAALAAVLREQCEAIRKEAPDFDPAALADTPLTASFPALEPLVHGDTLEHALGERSFRLLGTPMRGEGAELLGTVVEWRELTQQRIAQHQIEGMIYGAKKGHLDWRLELDKFSPGFWRELATGINEMLDALVQPLDLAAVYVDEIAHGKTPAKITTKYAGHVKKVTDNLNRCIDAIAALIDDAGAIAVAGAAGALHVRADASRHEGAFRRIVEGFNDTLDAIATPLADTRRVVEALAEGDLTQRVEVDARGDFAVLRDAMNGSLDKLVATVDEIRRAATSMRTATGEIASGNQDLSRRTEAQALSVERTNAGMKSLSETLVHNTRQSVQADELAQTARSQAVDGGEVVGAAVQAMKEINESSSRIADIIAVIDEIAFQTNLLALNAAVEAARAGEHGRGFAVVAGEVRNLAQRSATAAKEIKTLIQTSVQRVEDGSRLVNDSGGTLTAIVESIKRVSTIIGEVASASRAQTGSVGELNEAVRRIEESTQQNAALVEEIAAASKSLEDQADRMVGLVDSFRTDGRGAGTSRTTRRVA